jgi:argininosuccinate synthase
MNRNRPSDPTAITLAYSGGLDTSVIVHWIKQRYKDARVLAFVANLGQGEELNGIKEKAAASGADEVVVVDARAEFVEEFCFRLLRVRAVYESGYLLGTALARPLIARLQIAAARRFGADAVAHGCTGKGNDQVRFETAYRTLAPDLKIVAPWKDPDFPLTSREAALKYAAANGIPVGNITAAKIYSRDSNLWNVTAEGGPLDDPALEPPDDVFASTTPVSRAPDQPDYVRVAFEGGRPVGLDGERLDPVTLLTRLNALAGRHGVGQQCLVENRLVGIKSRGAYETPGGTVLYEALRALEDICLERDTRRLKEQLAVKYGEMIYYGQWYHPLREALQAFVDECTRVIDGSARVKLFKGRAVTVGVESPRSLYDPELASFAMGAFDVTAARGFIDLFSLPAAVRGQRQRVAQGGAQ